MKRQALIILLSILSLNLFCQYHWTKHPDNPIMVPGNDGEWTYDAIEPATVMLLDSTYHMYYHAATNGQNWALGHATSLDGIIWIKDSVKNPVLELGVPGAWDSYWISNPTVIKIDTLFHMWYTGIADPNMIARIGHATSSDGIEWIKDPDNPVRDILKGIPAGNFCMDERVLYVDSLYHMYYGQGNWSSNGMEIWHATSQDGYSWINDPSNPVMEDNNTHIYPVAVFFDGEQYIMWYGKGSYWRWEFYLAFSDDGSSWKNYDYNPVFTKGAPDSWDGLCFTTADVLYDSAETKYKMWYGGARTEKKSRIGYAETHPPVEIPDTAFLNTLIEKGVDINGDSLISYTEAQGTYSLNASNREISDMSGLEAFVNLKTLYCDSNNLSGLDVSANKVLKKLDCSSNQLTALDLSNATLLTDLKIEGMSNLNEVCVWTTSFPPAEVTVSTEGSPNVCFETDCNGVCDPTDVDEYAKQSLSIFPNPVDDIITIVIENTNKATIEIYSLNGKLLLNKAVDSKVDEIDIFSYPKGMYFITIRSVDYVITRKIVKL